MAHWLISPELGDRRILQAGKWRWLRALGWMVALVFAIALAFGPTMEALAHKLPDQPRVQFLAHAVGALIVIVTYALLTRYGEDRRPTEVSIKAAPAGLLVGVAIGALLFAAVMGIMIGFHLYYFTYYGPASAWKATNSRWSTSSPGTAQNREWLLIELLCCGSDNT